MSHKPHVAPNFAQQDQIANPQRELGFRRPFRASWGPLTRHRVGSHTLHLAQVTDGLPQKKKTRRQARPQRAQQVATKGVEPFGYRHHPDRGCVDSGSRAIADKETHVAVRTQRDQARRWRKTSTCSPTRCKPSKVRLTEQRMAPAPIR